MRSQMTTLCYIERDNQYLMLHRNKKENDINHDKWIGVGGHFLENETPEECLLREVLEETGLILTSYRFRGLITFISDEWQTEYMCLFTADGFKSKPGREIRASVYGQDNAPESGSMTGDSGLIDCDEGELVWVDKNRIGELNLWEGDRIFLNLLETRDDFFTLKLVYRGDELVESSQQPIRQADADKSGGS
ncbi:MAG: 8-oxo-dGTP diphosphatase [Eubacterium sp.]|nr:8-oxo-dGTP diphosphatase [Eubacterium sp.]